MAILPGTRIRDNGVFGTITDNPLTAGAVTFNSANLALLSAVAGNHALVTLDPLREHGAPEIVMVTAHTAAATVATIQRGMFGTVARSHPQGSLWVHAAADNDFREVVTSGTRPTDQYEGQPIYETDTDRLVSFSGIAWQQEGLFFDPPACRVFNNASIGIANGVTTILPFNSERYDTDSMHSTSVNTSRITFNTPGIYSVGGNIDFSSDTDYTDLIFFFRLDGNVAITPAFVRDINPGTAVGSRLMNLSMTYKFTAGQYVELLVSQTNTSGATNNIESLNQRSPEFWATWIGRGN